MSEQPLLSVRDLSVEYWSAAGEARAVDRVSFDLRRGEILGMAGESGSGKSTLALSVMRMLGPPAVITGGQVLFDGQDVLEMSEEQLRRWRWAKVSMVFQSAMNALNPVLTIFDQIADTLYAHRDDISPEKARSEAVRLVELVGIDPDRLDAYPHMLSGGMRQRVAIAIALALSPPLLIMDEPTTALDVVVQHEILQRITELRDTFGFSILFITHDLPLMLQFCDRIGILYGGRLAELGPSEQLHEHARHPYTHGLMHAMPDVITGDEELHGIPGAPPSLLDPPPGCRFAPRCASAIAACSQTQPPLTEVGAGHVAACHLIE